MDSVFSAKDSALGYLYQIRYGLMCLIEKHDANALLLIESLDDITIESNSNIEVYQTKHHKNSSANLTDASPDLWKTIRVWSNAILNNLIDPEKCIFNLITTSTATSNSIPFSLKENTINTRNIDEIHEKLFLIATSSENESNKDAYADFLALSEEQRKILIKKIILCDAAVDVQNVETNIKASFYYNVQSDKLEQMFERIEGWYLGQVILQLQNLRGALTGQELTDKILDIADRFSLNNLPDDFTYSIASDEQQLSQYRSFPFVVQLELIGANNQIINHAISDYHRAYSQKSKWVRDGLLNANEEDDYDKKLEDDWSRKFAILSDYENEDDEKKKDIGKIFYESHYVNVWPQIHIRNKFKEQYMVTGSCQILSGKKRMGWHPDFKNLLK